MATGSFFTSDLFSLYHVVQNTQILYAKELLVSSLKEYFAKDSEYHYVSDVFGFPKVLDHTDVPVEAGLEDDLITRIYIGQTEKEAATYFPAVLVKHTGSSYAPISFNQESECIQYSSRLYIDGYGNKYPVSVPSYFLFYGAWNSTFDIDVITESNQDRGTIVEAISILFQNILNWELQRNGLFVKSTRVGPESIENYNNDNLFKQTISLDCRGEYKRAIPIENLVQIIDICVEFGQILPDGSGTSDPNLQINFDVTIDDMINSIANI